MKILVMYALPEQQWQKECNVAQGTNVRQAIELSGILRDCPEINLSTHKLGIYGEVVSGDTQLADGDRIEIYRPLQIDPKQARLLRAKRNPLK